jgi:hypothetical protein
MTTAASLLIDTLNPAAKTAAPGMAMPGGAPAQSLFTASFSALLAEGNFVQAPGMVPTEGEGVLSLAALLSLGDVEVARDGEFDPAFPAFNVIPLFDTTSLSTPAPAIPGLGLGVTSLISDGAPGVGSNAAPTGDSSVAPAVSPVAGPAAMSTPTSPTDSPLIPPAWANPERSDSDHGRTVDPRGDLPVSPQSALKGVTAADLMADIAHFDSQGTGLGTAAVEAATPGGRRIGTLPPVTPTATSTALPTATVSSPPPPPVSAAAGPLAAPTALSLAAGTADPSAAGGQAARDGQAPDPRVIGRIVQVGQVQVTVDKPVAKPAVGLSSALRGDVALAAMAMPKPSETKAPPTAVAIRGAAPMSVVAGADAHDPQPSPQATSQQPSSLPQSPSGPLSPSPATPGQTLDTAPPGAEFRLPMAEISDQPAAPRVALDARTDTPPPALQLSRAGDAAAQPERPMAMPTPPPAPPAEQVAMQLRHAVAKGIDKITIQLSPASLGAIEVTLEVSSGARVQVHVVVEKADTLELLRADARGLERALQEAGLRTDSGSLNFNLRGDGGGAQHQNTASLKDFDETAADGEPGTDGDADSDSADASPENPTRPASDMTLDIEV